MDEHNCFANRLQLVSRGQTFLRRGHHQLEMINTHMDLLAKLQSLNYDLVRDFWELRTPQIFASI